MSRANAQLKDEGSTKQVLLAGAIAGLISRFCIAPLDVLKIRLQLQTHAFSTTSPALHGLLPTARNIFRDGGIRGFWRGNLSAELLYVTYGASQFTAYRLLSPAFSDTMPAPAAHFFAGAGAGTFATTLTYPLDLLRTRFAAQGTTRVYASLRRSIADILRAEGPRGFFQGLGAGVAQIVPNMGIFFCVYEGLRPALHGWDLPGGSGDALAGIAASVAAKTGAFPLDLARKRLQVQGPMRESFAGGTVPEYGRGAWRTVREILRREGVRGLYRGLGVSLVKAAPASAVTMWTYERAMEGLQQAETRWEQL